MLFGPKLFITLFSVLLSRYKRTKKSRLHEYLLKLQSIFPRETNLSRTGGTSNSVSLLTPASHSRSGAGWENRPCFLTQIFMRPIKTFLALCRIRNLWRDEGGLKVTAIRCLRPPEFLGRTSLNRRFSKAGRAKGFGSDDSPQDPSDFRPFLLKKRTRNGFLSIQLSSRAAIPIGA